MKLVDITDKVIYGWNDGESLPIEECICGQEFTPWEFFIGVYEKMPKKCPNCKRKLIFRSEIKIYEVQDE